MFLWGVVAYAGLSVVAVLLSEFWLERSAFVHPAPWLSLTTAPSVLYSTLLGLALAVTVVVSSRISVRRFDWARRLHEDFRPVARRLSSGSIALLALSSGIGEELLFRGVLHPLLGLLPQALLFGIIHQLPGRSRWVWVTWAGIVGLAFGAIFELTGSLIGPILAHALVNGLNLQHLKDHDPTPSRQPLGGLLNRTS